MPLFIPESGRFDVSSVATGVCYRLDSYLLEVNKDKMFQFPTSSSSQQEGHEVMGWREA
jgi:hypothetical protein